MERPLHAHTLIPAENQDAVILSVDGINMVEK